jgi:Na+/proline symporter
MKKPVYGMALGAVLGALDGLSSLVSAPETAPGILGIVVGSTFKGVVAGVLIGWFATRVKSLASGMMFGLTVGALLAWAIVYLQSLEPNSPGYFWEIMLPGSLVGLLVGYATQRERRTA